MMFQNNRETLSKVVVLGSGVSPANGLYYSKDNNSATDKTASAHCGTKDALMYEKKAVWNQEKVKFVIYSTNSGQYYTQFKLGVIQKTQSKVLYNSPAFIGTCGNKIPEQSWAVEDDTAEGLHPPPETPCGSLPPAVSLLPSRQF